MKITTNRVLTIQRIQLRAGRPEDAIKGEGEDDAIDKNMITKKRIKEVRKQRE